MWYYLNGWQQRNTKCWWHSPRWRPTTSLEVPWPVPPKLGNVPERVTRNLREVEVYGVLQCLPQCLNIFLFFRSVLRNFMSWMHASAQQVLHLWLRIPSQFVSSSYNLQLHIYLWFIQWCCQYITSYDKISEQWFWKYAEESSHLKQGSCSQDWDTLGITHLFLCILQLLESLTASWFRRF